MTVVEFRDQLNNTYGLRKWPGQLTVDHETYANVCQAVFNHDRDEIHYDTYKEIKLALGHNNGIMFKGIELILEK